MNMGIRARIAAFLVLSAVGIVYVAGNYLGLVDRVLGRGITVHATLPSSGGLYVGSEVDYRGVKIGRVSSMEATEDGVHMDLALQDGTRLPLDSTMYVHNLSAVGEQYLDFEPPDAEGPYAEDGDTLHGTQKSLPVDEGDLLVELNDFVSSVDKKNLQVVVHELGDMFRDTGRPLQRLLDNGSTFVREASAHSADTIRLLDTSKRVLTTQQGASEDIRSFARHLHRLTGTLAHSDGDLRTVLQETPATARELDGLLRDLGPTLPVLLGNAVSVNQVLVSHLAGIEQLLVTYPRVIATGFTGTPSDGWGHVNMQLDYDQPPCTKGYKPRDQWRSPQDLTDAPIFPAHCASGAPYAMRGTNFSPGTPNNPSPRGSGSAYRAAYRSSYDPRTGVVAGAVDSRGKPVRFADQGDLSILGGDAWKWLLVGPAASR